MRSHGSGPPLELALLRDALVRFAGAFDAILLLAAFEGQHSHDRIAIPRAGTPDRVGGEPHVIADSESVLEHVFSSARPIPKLDDRVVTVM